MLAYVVVGVPVMVTTMFLSFFAATDPIEATIEAVRVAPAYEAAGFGEATATMLLHAELEEIGQVTGSWDNDKRVRVATVKSGAESLANALFGLDNVLDAGLRALNIIDYVVDVQYVAQPNLFSAIVQFHDPFTGNFIIQKRFNAEGSAGNEGAVTQDVMSSLTEQVAQFIIQETEPYLFSAYLYSKALKGDGSLEDVFRHIDTHIHGVRADKVPWMHNLRGLVAMDAGVPAYAIREFSRALELDPTFAPAHINLGRVSYTLGDYEKAVDRYRRGIRHDNHAVGHLYLAEALIKLGDPQGARSSLEQAIRLESDFPRVYEVLSGLLMAEGDAVGARRADLRAAEARRVGRYEGRFVPF